MGKGWDVVKIHLLTLHMISIVDGHCIMQISTIFLPKPLWSEHGKISLLMCNTWAGEAITVVHQ